MSERWPTWLPPPPVTGAIRTRPEDFQVEEIPAYLPAGDGNHLMLELEKRDRTTEEVIQALARHLGLPSDQLGCAGLKDRRALTRQWLSVPASGADALKTFRLEGVEILRSARHRNKLRTGHLKGNRFRILVRGLDQPGLEFVESRGLELSRYGVPNYFGPQRFGKGGDNEAEGRALLCGQGRRHDRRSLRFLLSVAQAGLFNDALAQRLKRGWFLRVLWGDVLAKVDTGGMFLCTDPAFDQARMDAFEICPTGPIFGPKMKSAQGEPGALEREVLGASGLEPGAFRRFAKLTRGGRRALRLMPSGLQVKQEADGTLISFTLPPGGYATSLLRELIQSEERQAVTSH